VSAWIDRSREEAHLFNPGFLSLLVWSTVAGYEEATGEGLPFELAFVALPLSLHKPTREALPRSPRTSLAAWLEANAYFRVGFGERAKDLPHLRARPSSLHQLTDSSLPVKVENSCRLPAHAPCRGTSETPRRKSAIV